jgi:hypothetical protein
MTSLGKVSRIMMNYSTLKYLRQAIVSEMACYSFPQHSQSPSSQVTLIPAKQKHHLENARQVSAYQQPSRPLIHCHGYRFAS